MNKSEELIRVNVANIVFSVHSNKPRRAVQLCASYSSFVSSLLPEVIVRANYDGLHHIVLHKDNMVFDSEGAWSLYRINGRNAIVLGESGFKSFPNSVAVFDDYMKQVEVYNVTELLSGELLPDPIQYPLAEVLMIILMAQGRGVLVHACGINDNGRGYLFAGNSTNGKSTMARLWRDKATILNDDRIVLRKRDGRFWMYGTPWHGDYTEVSPQGIPLEKIFFLRHAEANTFSRKQGVTASSMLLTRCFPPLWDKEGMNFMLGFCDQLMAEVSSYELGFVPDEKVVDFVRCIE